MIGCWVPPPAPGCSSTRHRAVARTSPRRGPWDFDVKTGLPSFTTVGNAANTHEAWASPLTPGGRPRRRSRRPATYDDAFTDAWNNSKCDPTQLHPGGNDINAVGDATCSSRHNRMHDFSYYLGFTEENYNLQVDNLGRNGDPTRENDPEIGNAQAGALTGGQPSYLGRDNANQIALQDGVPGITNQYLFQPIAGAFYSPCADGALDMSIVGHEYTHAISNRMIGGPDDGHHLRAGRRDGRVLGRPGRARVPVRARLLHRRANPWVGRPLRHRQQGHRHPRLRASTPTR